MPGLGRHLPCNGPQRIAGRVFARTPSSQPRGPRTNSGADFGRLAAYQGGGATRPGRSSDDYTLDTSPEEMADGYPQMAEGLWCSPLSWPLTAMAARRLGRSDEQNEFVSSSATPTGRCWPLGSGLRLLDHLVGACQQCLGHRNAKCIRGLEIDPKLELCRLFDRDIGGLDASE